MLAVLVIVAMLPALVSASVWEGCAIAATLVSALLIRRIAARVSSSEQGERWCASLWGALVPLVPVFGSNGVVAISLGLAALLGERRVTFKKLIWVAPLLGLASGAVIAEVLRQSSEYFGALSFTDLRRARSITEWFIATHAHSWRYLSHLIMFALVVSLLESSEAIREGVRRGLVVGASCAALVTVVQFVGYPPLALPNQTTFWTAINRLSGTFSDPNAQGIFLALVPFLIFKRIPPSAGEGKVLWLLAPLLLSAGLLSGSRSFIVAVILGVFFAIWIVSRRVALLTCCAGVVAVAALSFLDLYTSYVGQLLDSEWIPEGCRRMVTTLSIPRATESFFSRGVFLKLGLELFDHFPLFGVGADRFRYYVPALVDRLGLDIGGWVDNSNNFYLGILTEQGILGAILFAMAVRGRTLVREATTVPMIGLLVLCCLLTTGPHLDFPEVLFVTAMLTAVTTGIRATTCGPLTAAACLGFGIGILGVFTREQGGYLWEGRGSTHEQWLSPAAEIFAACRCDGFAQVDIESAYVPSTAPLTVNVVTSQGESRDLQFTRAEVKRAIFACSTGEGFPSPSRLRLSITSSLGWSPARAWPSRSTDDRIFGVKLRGRRWQDLLGAQQCVELTDSLREG